MVMRLERGQLVPKHTTPSSVTLTVLEGSGKVVGAEGERTVVAGDVIVYESGEPHAMPAPDGLFVVLVTIHRSV